MCADVLGLAQMFIAYQTDAALLWRVTDRAVVAAHESGNVKAIAGATWFAMEAYRDSGDWDTAMLINLDALRLVESRLGDSDHELLALYGALQTAPHSQPQGRARKGEPGTTSTRLTAPRVGFRPATRRRGPGSLRRSWASTRSA